MTNLGGSGMVEMATTEDEAEEVDNGREGGSRRKRKRARATWERAEEQQMIRKQARNRARSQSNSAELEEGRR